MTRARCVCVLLLTLVLIANRTANAKPVSLSVDSTQSSLTVKVSGTVNGQPITSATQTGIASINLFGTPPGRTYDPDGTGPNGTVVQSLGLVGDLADGPGPNPKPPGTLTTTTDVGFAQPEGSAATLKVKLLGLNFSGTLKELHATLLPGTVVPTSSTGGPTGSSQYDLAGLKIAVDGGIIGLAGIEVFNFFTDPLDPIEIPTGLAQTTIAWDSLAPNNNRPVTLSLPLALTTTIVDVVTFELIQGIVSTLSLNVNIAFSGDIVMKGTRIPEPQSLILLGIGLLGTVPLVRQRLWRPHEGASKQV